MKAGRVKTIGKHCFAIQGLCCVLVLLIIVFLIPPTTAIAKQDHSLSDDIFRLYIYPAAVAFWWKCFS